MEKGFSGMGRRNLKPDKDERTVSIIRHTPTLAKNFATNDVKLF